MSGAATAVSLLGGDKQRAVGLSLLDQSPRLVLSGRDAIEAIDMRSNMLRLPRGGRHDDTLCANELAVKSAVYAADYCPICLVGLNLINFSGTLANLLRTGRRETFLVRRFMVRMAAHHCHFQRSNRNICQTVTGRPYGHADEHAEPHWEHGTC